MITGAQEKLLQQLDYENPAAIAETMDLIIAYGDSRDAGDYGDYGDLPGPDDLRSILAIVDNFCRETFAGNEVHIQICRECYGQAMYESFFDGPLEPNSYLQYLSENIGGPEGIEEGGGQITVP